MTNIFLETPVYITVAEVKDSTTIGGLATLWNNDVQVLIVKSENTINNYLWYSIPMADITDEEVIKDFKIATFYMVEELYTESITGETDNIKSETSGDRKIEYFSSGDSAKFMNKYWMPDSVITILAKYKQIFYKQVI